MTPAEEILNLHPHQDSSGLWDNEGMSEGCTWVREGGVHVETWASVCACAHVYLYGCTWQEPIELWLHTSLRGSPGPGPSLTGS